jgi:hypothetical protein
MVFGGEGLFRKDLLLAVCTLCSPMLKLKIEARYQCCGFVFAYIERNDPVPHLDPNQNDKLDPDQDPYQFADEKPNVRNMSLFEYFFKVLSFCLEARIRIRIRS